MMTARLMKENVRTKMFVLVSCELEFFKGLTIISSLGPLLKNTVFDAFFGVVSSLLLMVGGCQENQCLIISWIVVTAVTSIKYVWRVLLYDWSSLEDWIAITYLFFYILVFLIVISFLIEITSWRRNSAAAFSQPYLGEMKFLSKF